MSIRRVGAPAPGILSAEPAFIDISEIASLDWEKDKIGKDHSLANRPDGRPAQPPAVRFLQQYPSRLLSRRRPQIFVALVYLHPPVDPAHHRPAPDQRHQLAGHSVYPGSGRGRPVAWRARSPP